MVRIPAWLGRGVGCQWEGKPPRAKCGLCIPTRSGTRATTATPPPSFKIERGEFMPAKIEVEEINKSKFRVRITEYGSETSHAITVSPRDYTKLTNGKVEPEDLVRRSFEFLLEREPKESILTRFDLSVINRYFPEYESEIKRRLS
jgi:hypothetical protein